MEIVEKYEHPYKQKSVDVAVETTKPTTKIRHTRTSELRQRRASSDAGSTKRSRSKSSR